MGSRQWIGSFEVSYVLDHLLGVSKFSSKWPLFVDADLYGSNARQDRFDSAVAVKTGEKPVMSHM